MPLRYFIYSLLFTFSCLTAAAQAPVIQWQSSFGGSAHDYAFWGIEQTTDGGYITAGRSYSTDGDVTGNHGDSDYWIVKLTAFGSIQWQKAIGGSGLDDGTYIIQTSDGGYIVTGYSMSNDGDVSGNHGGEDISVVKLSPFGSIQWQKSFGGSYHDVSSRITQTNDGGYIIAGSTHSSDGDVTGYHWGDDYWVLKLSSSGSIQWQKALGGGSNDWAVSIQQTFDGGYIVVGESNSIDGDVTGNHGGSDIWIVNLTSSGGIQWQKSYGGSGNDWGMQVKQTFDSGYIVVGTSNSNDGDVSGNHGGSDYWVLKLSPSGSIQWQKSYGGTGNDSASFLQITFDSSYLITGGSSSNDGDVTGNHGGMDEWILKISPTGGIIWEQSYGGSNNDFACGIQQTTDSSFIIAGASKSNDGDVSGNHGDWDYWIVKLGNCYINAGMITGIDSVCVGGTITFIETVSGGVWGTTHGKGTFSGSTFTALTPGIETITYAVTDTCGTAAAIKNIFIKPLHRGAITGPDSVCAWYPAAYIDTIPGGTWSVTNINGTIDSVGNFTGMLTGFDTVLYISVNACGTDTARKPVKIKPLAVVDLIGGPNGVCEGDTILASSGVPGGVWAFSNGHATVAALTGKVTGISAGRDTLTYIVTNSCNADTATKVIFITAYPHAGTISGPSSVCVGATIYLSDTAQSGFWKSSNNSATVFGNVGVTGVAPGIDTIIYIVTNACATDSAAWQVTVNPLPAIPPITRTGNILSVPTGYTSYQWLLNGAYISGATSNTCTVTTLTNYYVDVTNSLGCIITSFPETITELECTLDDMRVYPNPAASTLYIDWCKKVNTELTGMDGKLIKTNNTNNIDLQNLPNGTYHLSIFDLQGKKLKTQKITHLRQ